MTAYDAVDGSSNGIAICQDCGCCYEAAYVGLWHNPDLRLAAPEGLLTSGLPTLGAECLILGGKPTVIQGVPKVGS